MGDRRLAPSEVRVVIGADQRNILRHAQASLGQIVERRVEEERFFDNQRGRRRGAEKRVQQCHKSLLALLPIRQVEGTRRNAVGCQLIEECLLGETRLRQASVTATHQRDPPMTELDQATSGSREVRRLVRSYGGD